MRTGLSLKPQSWPPRWRVCVCVLLVVLVIYNPFSALSGFSGNLSYDQLARNRASIGAGELQQFSPVSNPELQTVPDVDLRGEELPRSAPERPLSRDQQDVTALEPAVLAGVWFRPPPSL